ncbi:MAG: peptide-methionine (S)-S-oxide reductase MsrA [Pseudomonadota bacterium]
MHRLIAAIALFICFALPINAADTRTMVVAGGCFWCVESDFDKVEGVSETVSGYSGGTLENPTYRDIGRKKTGHLEVVQITYDPDVVSYAELVHLFLRSIDPLDAGGQFCDRGEPYTTAIFTASAAERQAATDAVATAEAALGTALATTVRDAATFYPAEDYHQNFYKKNPIRYSTYRRGCGRDARVKELWGEAAAFHHGS